MLHPGRFRFLAFLISTSFLSTGLLAQGDPAAIQQQLNAQFKLTKITADRSDIVTPGDVVVLHKPGLLMYSVAASMPSSNTYRKDKIVQGWGGFGRDLAIGISSPVGSSASDYPHRIFVPDEKCWVTGIEVQKDGVVFQLYSDPYDDVRYYASLKFPFPHKKEVPTTAAVLQQIAEVLTVAPADNQTGDGQAGDGAQPAQGANSAAAPPAQPPAPATPMPAIAPPPPPPDAAPPTIAMGQTVDQVTAAFGQPLREAKLGARQIFYYKDMKVTFTNGKVSNVE